MHDVKKREFEGILNAVVTFMKVRDTGGCNISRRARQHLPRATLAQDPEAGEKAIHATAVLMGAKVQHDTAVAVKTCVG